MITTILFYLFWLTMGVQSIYLLFIFGRLLGASTKNKQKGLQTTPPPASVIIAAHNEEAHIKKLLDTLHEQDYPEYEIILINDRSWDGTYDLLLEIKNDYPKLKLVEVKTTPEHINEKKYALTLGIKAAKYEHLLFTDADCLPASDQWISEMMAAFSPNTELVLGFSAYQKRKGLLNYLIRFETLYTAIQYLSMCLVGKPYMGVGRNMAYQKSLFIRNKGFNSFQKITGGDDDLFVNRYATGKKTKIAIGKEKITISVPKTTLKEYFRQKKRHLFAGKYYKFSDKLILGILSLSHILFWGSFLALVILMKEPYLILGGFLVRMAVQYVIFSVAARKVGQQIWLWALPFLDFLYVMYYIFTGTSVIFSKKVKWK